MQVNSLSENARRRLLSKPQQQHEKGLSNNNFLTPSQIIQSAKQGLGQSIRPYTPSLNNDRPTSVMSEGSCMLGPYSLEEKKLRLETTSKNTSTSIYESKSHLSRGTLSISVSSSNLSLKSSNLSPLKQQSSPTSRNPYTQQQQQSQNTSPTSKPKFVVPHDECCLLIQDLRQSSHSCFCVAPLLKKPFSDQTGKELLEKSEMVSHAPKKLKLFLLQSFMQVAKSFKDSIDIQIVFGLMSLKLSDDTIVLLNSLKILYKVLKLKIYDFESDKWNVIGNLSSFLKILVGSLVPYTETDKQSLQEKLKLIKQTLMISKHLNLQSHSIDVKYHWIIAIVNMMNWLAEIMKGENQGTQQNNHHSELSITKEVYLQALLSVRCISYDIELLAELKYHHLLVTSLSNLSFQEDVEPAIHTLQQLGYLSDLEKVQQELHDLCLNDISESIENHASIPLPVVSRCLYFAANLSKSLLKHPMFNRIYTKILDIVGIYSNTLDDTEMNNETTREHHQIHKHEHSLHSPSQCQDERLWILSNSLCILANLATHPEIACGLFSQEKLLVCVDFLETQFQCHETLSSSKYALSFQNACTLIANLSYFFSHRSVIFNEKERIGKIMSQYLMSGHEEITVECARTIANFSRCESFRNHLLHLHGTQILVVLLEHHHRDIVYFVLGALMNLLAVDDFLVYKHFQILEKNKFLDLLLELWNLSMENQDWHLLKLILQSTFNYLILEERHFLGLKLFILFLFCSSTWSIQLSIIYQSHVKEASSQQQEKPSYSLDHFSKISSLLNALLTMSEGMDECAVTEENDGHCLVIDQDRQSIQQRLFPDEIKQLTKEILDHFSFS